MKLSALLVACSLLLSTQANANFITNGDFQTCNFNGWSLDTDGNGEPADTSDFSIINNAGQCSAQISTENLFPDGFSNTLFTQLDLSSVTDGVTVDLSFDWIFDGDDLQTDAFSDAFSVVLNDGFNIEPLLFGFQSGSGTFITQLDNSYDGYFLDFILEPGFNAQSFSSTLTIDNVSLVESTAVFAPQTPFLLALGLGVIAFRRSKLVK